MYKELNLDKVLATIKRLESRIFERIPNSSIKGVCSELLDIAKDAKNQIDDLSKPNKWIRIGVVISMISFVAVVIYTLSIVEWEIELNLAEVIQITEALINNLILVSAAIFFLITFEQRQKRRSVLQALHKLRSIAHVVDMHQLTKDPSIVNSQYAATDSSPLRTMTDFELERYLDYCSEMFSLIGKIAALYSERLPEPEVVSAANDIEALCSSLSSKVWQKIVILDKS